MRQTLSLDQRQAHWELTALIEHTLQWDAAYQELFASKPLIGSLRHQLDAHVESRLAGIPAAHILGYHSFRGIPLRCSPATLVPRPETEQLIDFVLDNLPVSPALRVADLGTGTGAIAIALAHTLPHAIITAMDICPAACAIARDNVLLHKLDERITVRNCSWRQLEGPVDIIISNPPYVPSGWCKKAIEHNLLHDPRLALDGGGDGLDSVRSLSVLADKILAPGSLLVMEHGIGQHHAICAIAENTRLGIHAWQRDYAGNKRIIALTKSKDH